MFSFQGENILSVNQLDRDCIERIFAVAKKWSHTQKNKSVPMCLKALF
jgi:aspartate carbamoyltransferase catalytic subunit